MKIIPCSQGTPEWLQARLGIPTASEFDALISPECKIRTGQGPTTYLYKKICEKVLGFTADGGSSFAMGQGSILENEALPWFSFAHEVNVQRVVFCTTDDGRIGCSPDGLIGEDGGIEIKCPTPETHLRYLMEGGLPKEHWAQVHGSMFVTGRKWWNFLSYSRQFPAFLIRVESNPEIIETMSRALYPFVDRLDEQIAKIVTMRDAENALKTAAYEAANKK